MKYRNNIPSAVSLGAVVIISAIASTAAATESSVPFKQPEWAFDTNIKNSNLIKPPSGHDRLGIQTLGIGIDSHSKIHAALWGTMLPIPPVRGNVFGQLIDYGSRADISDAYTVISDMTGSAPVIDEKNHRAYFTTKNKSLIAVPLDGVGGGTLWESPALDDGWLSMPALSQDGETIYLQGCKDPKETTIGTVVYYAFSSDGKQKWRIEGVSDYNGCHPGRIPYAPVIDSKGRPYFTSYVTQNVNKDQARAIETIVDGKRTGALESYQASAPAIAHDRLYFVAPVGEKTNGRHVAALKSAPAEVTLGQPELIKTLFTFGNWAGARNNNPLQSPVIAGNTAYVVDPYLGTVYALALDQENEAGQVTKLWEFKPVELLPPSASVAANVSITVSKNGTIYVTAGRYLHALDSEGHEKWRYKYAAITDENLKNTSVEIGAGIRTVTLDGVGAVFATVCKDSSDKCGLLTFGGDGSPVAAPWGKVGGNAANTGHEFETDGELMPVPEAIVGKHINVVATTSNGFSYKLDGSKSLNAVTYQWRKLNGPFSVRNQNSAIAEAVVPKNTTGEGTFQLTVTDKDGKQHTAETKVTVGAPGVTINGPTAINHGKEVSLIAQANFKGAGGRDPGYDWTMQDSTGKTVLTRQHPQLDIPPTLKAGKYQVTLTAASSHGARKVTAKQTFDIRETAEGDSAAPQAIVGNDLTVVRTESNGFAYKLDGSKSRNAVTYQWIKLEGNYAGIRNENNAVAEAIVPKKVLGSVKYQLTVTSKDGRQDTATIKVSSIAPNVTIAGPASITQGQTVSLIAQANFKAADGSAPTYSWRVRNLVESEAREGTAQQFDLSTLAAGSYLATMQSSTPHGGRAASARHTFEVK
ncbi:PKD domain-containing protein [Glaciimonas sp. GG7]